MDNGKLLTTRDFRNYQTYANAYQLANPATMLWLDPGLGKTATTLTTVKQRMLLGQVKKTLVVAPVRVATSVWEQEAAKWAHLKDLSFGRLLGSKKAREIALFTNRDVYLVNYENLVWLAETLKFYYRNQPLPFQFIVYDEVTKMKNSTAKRHKTWYKVAMPIPYKTGLTGTPAANGYLDLHGQYLVVDNGERLGEFITGYKDAFFQSDYNGWKYTPTVEGAAEIERRISDITIRMSAADYLTLPDVRVNDIPVTLPQDVRARYAEFQKEFFVTLASGASLEVPNTAALYAKCLQLANGSVIVDSHTKEPVHDGKLDALDEILSETSTPVLCLYTFRDDPKRIINRFNSKTYRVVDLTREPSSRAPKIIRDFQNGDIRLLLGHPASMGHGIDGLQHGCSTVVWYGMPWSLELYEQSNARVNRQGQRSKVTIHRILAANTLDTYVVEKLWGKAETQVDLMKTMNVRIT